MLSEKINELFGTLYKSNLEINWGYLLENFDIPENIIEEGLGNSTDLYLWLLISSRQFISEDFIRKYRYKVDWTGISASQVLSNEFIEEFQDQVSWFDIINFQPFIDSKVVDLFMKHNKGNRALFPTYLSNNKLYKLYQKTKDQGWFFGYLVKEGFIPDEFVTDNNFYTENIIPAFYTKVRVWWKDLRMTSRIKKYEYIREAKYL